MVSFYLKSISKKGAQGLNAVKFILNIIAVLIMVFGIRGIVDNNTRSALYSANQDALIELNYALFSEDGLMPDRFTLDISDARDRLDNIDIEKISMRFVLNYDGKTDVFFLDETRYEKMYPLREFNSYMYDVKSKPVLVDNGSAKHFGNLDIYYIFKKEEAPRNINKNG